MFKRVRNFWEFHAENSFLSIFWTFSEVERLLFPSGVEHFLKTARELVNSSKFFWQIAFSQIVCRRFQIDSIWGKTKAANVSPEIEYKTAYLQNTYSIMSGHYELWSPFSLLIFGIFNLESWSKTTAGQLVNPVSLSRSKFFACLSPAIKNIMNLYTYLKSVVADIRIYNFKSLAAIWKMFVFTLNSLSLLIVGLGFVD